MKEVLLQFTRKITIDKISCIFIFLQYDICFFMPTFTGRNQAKQSASQLESQHLEVEAGSSPSISDQTKVDSKV